MMIAPAFIPSTVLPLRRYSCTTTTTTTTTSITVPGAFVIDTFLHRPQHAACRLKTTTTSSVFPNWSTPLPLIKKLSPPTSLSSCNINENDNDLNQFCPHEQSSLKSTVIKSMSTTSPSIQQGQEPLNSQHPFWRTAIASLPLVSLLCAYIVAHTILLGSPQSVHAYGLQNGRLEKCKGDAPCISTTSVGNPSKFGPPWSYQPETDDPATAWASLRKAIEANLDKGVIVESHDGPVNFYLRAEFPSALNKGIDDVEFRLLPADALVTYRSASREAVFLYPIQTPIDTNKNKKRLDSIRLALGWEEFAGEELYIDGSASSKK